MHETQKQKILRILSDFQPHCLTNECYIKDDRTRISELRKQGYIFDETLGNCIDSTHRHSSGMKLRRLKNNPLGSPIPIPNEKVAKWAEQFKKPVEEIKQRTLL